MDAEMRARARKIEGDVWDVRKETSQLRQELKILEEMEDVLSNVTRKRQLQVENLRDSRQQRRIAGLPGGSYAQLHPWGDTGDVRTFSAGGSGAGVGTGGGGSLASSAPALEALLGGNPRRGIDTSALMHMSANDILQLGTHGLSTIRRLQADLAQVQVTSEEQAVLWGASLPIP